MTPHDEQTTDRVAALLQHSGPRPAPSRRGFETARTEARTAWEADVRGVQRQWRMRMAMLTLATAATLVVAVSYYRSADRPQPVMAARVSGSSTTLNINDVYRTGAGDRTRLTLANGVELRLDADTEIRFPSAASVALERGGLFVDTGASHDPGGSVEIHTPAGIARDIGTRFEVRVIARTTRVRVRDGIVQLTHGSAIHTAKRGTELVADPSGVALHDAPTGGADWDWVALAAAPFAVEGKTLPQFLEWVAREGGWEIRFADDALRRSTAGIVLHGSIAGLTPEQALETILPTCGLTHRIERDVVTIRAVAGAGSNR